MRAGHRGRALAHRLCRLGQLLQWSGGAVHQALAGFGQHQPLRATLQQPHAELLLQVGHPARQRGLGPAACAAGPAEAAVGGHQGEVGQGVEVHVFQMQDGWS